MMNNSRISQVNIGGNVLTGVGTLQGDFNQLFQLTGSVDRSINIMFANIQKKSKGINLNALAEQIEKVRDGIAGLLAPGIGFEQSMARLSATTGIVGEDLRILSQAARRTGMDSGLGAEQAVSAFALLASHIQVDKIGMEGLLELHKNVIVLSQAAGLSMDEAARALTGTIERFGLQATEANRIVNVLVAGFKYGDTEITDLSQSFRIVGDAAQAAGLSIESIAGAVEVLGRSGMKGMEAGMALREIIQKMQSVSDTDLRESNFSEALDALKPKLSDAAYLSKAFGTENVVAARFLIENADAVAEMTQCVTDTNAAQELAAIRTETTQQMMERCRSKIEDLKISFFELTGSAGGYAAIIVEQAVTLTQLIPLFSLLRKGIQSVIGMQKLQALWTNVVNGATVIWTGVQWFLNASLWACPLTWIVAGILAFIAVIAVCVTKVEGWGKQWDSIVNFMKAVWELFCENFRFEWNLLTGGIMIGLDYIRLGWYKFKEACGLGDSSENRMMISQIGADIERRQQDIIDGAMKIRKLTEKATNSLTWELSWKQDDEKGDLLSGIDAPERKRATTSPNSDTDYGLQPVSSALASERKSTGAVTGSLSPDLNQIVPDLKGSTSYGAVVSRLFPTKVSSSVSEVVDSSILFHRKIDSDRAGGNELGMFDLRKVVPDWSDSVSYRSFALDAGEIGYAQIGAEDVRSQVPAGGRMVPNLKGAASLEPAASRRSTFWRPVVAAAVSVAMPMTMAATVLPQNMLQHDPDKTEYAAQIRSGKTVNVARFCDKIEIHIASADGKGYRQIQSEVANVLKQVLDDYEA